MHAAFSETDKRRKNVEAQFTEAQAHITDDTAKIQELSSQNDRMKVCTYMYQTHVYVIICMQLCMYVCMYVCIYLSIYLSIYLYLYTWFKISFPNVLNVLLSRRS